MTQEKRILLAFALSFLLMMGWRFLYPPPDPPPETQTDEAPVAAEGEAEAPAPAAEPAGAPSYATLPVLRGSQAREIIVENGLYRIVFSTQGAVVKSWVLKEYEDSHQEESLREPLDVVNAAACEGVGYPFSLSLESADLTQKVNEAVYVTSPGPNRREAPTKLTFEFSDGKSPSQEDLFPSTLPTWSRWTPRSLTGGATYRMGFTGTEDLATVSSASETSCALPRWFTVSARNRNSPTREMSRENSGIPGPLELAGLSDRYFAGIFLPGSTDSSFRISKRTWEPPDWTDEDKPEIVEMALARTEFQSEPLRLFCRAEGSGGPRRRVALA